MKLYSYQKVWNVEKRIYSFQNVHLPVPVKPVEIGYFLLIFAIMFILGKLLPFMAAVPPILSYGIFPFAIIKFMLKMKLDGKPPQKFFVGYIRYLSGRRDNIEFFRKARNEYGDNIKLNWKCSSRNSL